MSWAFTAECSRGRGTALTRAPDPRIGCGGRRAAMIVLTEDQRLELARPEPVAIDPQTNEQYVLVRKEVYDRIRALFDDDGPDMRQVGILVDRAMREEDEGDPTLAFYQEKYGRKS